MFPIIAGLLHRQYGLRVEIQIGLKADGGSGKSEALKGDDKR
jgi:hypothetical protein